jgi:hypothetical protein
VLFKMTPTDWSVRLRATLRYWVCELTYTSARHHPQYYSAPQQRVMSNRWHLLRPS